MMTEGLPALAAALVYALIPALCCIFASRGLIHFFQLDSYQFPGFFRTLRRNPLIALLTGVNSCAVCCVVYLLMHCFAKAAFPLRLVLLLIFELLAAGCGLLLGKYFSPRKAKKKMVLTPRLKRLYLVYFLVMLGTGWLLAVNVSAFSAMLWPLFLPLIFSLSALLAWPVEKLISECYFRDARRRLLSDPTLIRIGITGSYGKTSVKRILAAILSEKYPVLFTPASFNTPMGVSRAIREGLAPSHRIFIAEMGARHVGDIKELCRLVHPQIGIITSVGPQHLETFHSMDRIARGKYELIQALPAEGSHGYFWDDGAYLTKMYDQTVIPKTLCAFTPAKTDTYVDEIHVSPEGSSFKLHLGAHGSVVCTTLLLGEHNIQNILLAASVAADLGLSLKQIANAVSRLPQVEHRLQILHNAGGFTVIDDAYNANPVSAAAALKVLRQFNGRKIVITPGMVELGEKEKEYNREFGKQIASSADIAMIIGKKRVEPLLEGLRSAGFPQERLYHFDSLEKSTRQLEKIVQPGDIVLYENDLPDHYQET